MILHPYVVHLAIAVLTIGVFYDFLFLIKPKENFRKYANYLLTAGTIAAVVAVYTGNEAYDILEIPIEFKKMVWQHRDSGEWAMWLFVGMLAMRLLFMRMNWFNRPLKWIYYAISLIALLFLLRTGILGGQMAYIHGIGSSEAVEEKLQRPSFEE